MWTINQIRILLLEINFMIRHYLHKFSRSIVFHIYQLILKGPPDPQTDSPSIKWGQGHVHQDLWQYTFHLEYQNGLFVPKKGANRLHSIWYYKLLCDCLGGLDNNRSHLQMWHHMHQLLHLHHVYLIHFHVLFSLLLQAASAVQQLLPPI